MIEYKMIMNDIHLIYSDLIHLYCIMYHTYQVDHQYNTMEYAMHSVCDCMIISS